MGSHTWFNKFDVLRDLVEVKGPPVDVDNRYFVIGEVPPPLRVENSDAEIELRYGKEMKQNLCYVNKAEPQPDLEGITKMIRWVEDITARDEENLSPEPQKVDLVISKLDPTVKEFVPKAFQKKVESANKSLKILEDGNEIDNNFITVKNSESLQEKIIHTVVHAESSESIHSKEVDISRLKEEEVQKIDLELKDTISEASKHNTLQMKTIKNVAISNLLKLHSEPSTNSVSKPIKLITPDFYAKPLQTENHETSQPTQSICNQTHGISNMNPEAKYRCDDKSIQVNADQDLSVPDTVYRKSIEKVANWFDKVEEKPIRKPTRSMITSPITFRSKESLNTSAMTKDVDNKKTAVTSQEYKPSKYAEELERMYMEKNRKIEEEKLKNVWNNLDAILKKKEETEKEKEREKKIKDANMLQSESSESSSQGD